MPTKMKVVYVAGPYRGNTESDVVQNIRNAEAVAIRIWKMGHAAICPHKNTALFGGLCPDETWLRGDLEILKRCDEVVLVDGWQNSRGTRAEVTYVKIFWERSPYKIPVFESIDEWERVQAVDEG